MFKEGKRRCRRRGTGSPAICEVHREAMDVAWSNRPPGLGAQLGRMFDKVLQGSRPTTSDMEEAIAGVAGAFFNRTVTVEEVRRVRSAGSSPFSPPSSSSSSGPHGSSAPPPPDPGRAAKIEAAKAQGRARARLGFSAREPLTHDMIKVRRRELAKKYHPDHGGDAHRMQLINEAVELLLKSL